VPGRRGGEGGHPSALWGEAPHAGVVGDVEGEPGGEGLGDLLDRERHQLHSREEGRHDHGGAVAARLPGRGSLASFSGPPPAWETSFRDLSAPRTRLASQSQCSAPGTATRAPEVAPRAREVPPTSGRSGSRPTSRPRAGPLRRGLPSRGGRARNGGDPRPPRPRRPLPHSSEWPRAGRQQNRCRPRSPVDDFERRRHPGLRGTSRAASWPSRDGRVAVVAELVFPRG